jgi:hypothetical protein
MKQEQIILVVDPSTTVGECKAQIQDRVSQPASKIKFILKGKILADATTIGELNLNATEFIVVHCPASRAPPAAPPPAAAPPPTAAPPSAASPPAAAAPRPAAPLAAAAPPPPSQVRLLPGSGEAPAGPSEDQEQTIRMMIELGYPRTDCIEALRAAFGDPDRAIQYLQEGQLPPDPEGAAPVDDSLEQLRQIVIAHPSAIVNLIEIFAPQLTPEQNAAHRQNPEGFAAQLGLDPNSFPPGLFDQIRNGTAQPAPQEVFTNFHATQNRPAAAPAQAPQAPAPAPAAPARPPGQALLDRFSEAEREQIRALQGLGNFALPQVIHIYEASGKDAERAANLLFEML